MLNLKISGEKSSVDKIIKRKLSYEFSRDKELCGFIITFLNVNGNCNT